MASTTDDVVIVNYTATIMHILFLIYSVDPFIVLYSAFYMKMSHLDFRLLSHFILLFTVLTAVTVKYIFPYFALNYMIICENSAIVLTVNNHQLIFFGF